MATVTQTLEDHLAHRVQLADPDLRLDLASDRWNLAEPFASRVVGRDVVHVGRLAPDGGRRPIGVSIPAADQPLVDVWPCEMAGSTLVRYADVFKGMASTEYTMQPTGFSTPTEAIQRNFPPYAWPAEMVGGVLTVQEDDRATATGPRQTRIDSIQTTTETDDTLVFTEPLSAQIAPREKFHILYTVTRNLRGAFVSNGRKFWLLQGGVYTLYLDLGDDRYLGARWHMAQISFNRLMFVHPKYPARILRLSDDPATAATDNRSLAGLIAPVKPDDFETAGDDDTNTDKSFLGVADTSGGAMSAADYRVKVRAVNVDDGLESRFVNAYDNADRDNRDITVGGTSTSKLDVGTGTLSWDTRLTPPEHERWTHIEVWRTIGGPGGDYYLERRVEIADPNNEGQAGPDRLTALIETAGVNQPTCDLSDADLQSLTLMSATDLLAGYVPPLCKKVASLNGVTICAGASDAAPDAVTAYARGHYTRSANTSYTVSTKAILDATNSPFAGYTFKSGDLYEFIQGDPTGIPQRYAIASKTDDTKIILSSGPTVNVGSVEGCILRPLTLERPTVTSDEYIHYSRTDKSAPESFLTRTLQISDVGDILQALHNVGNYVAVLMTRGVHLLYFSGTTLVADTISASGDGTLWERSGVVLANQVLYATAQGPMVLSVSNGVDQNGHRGTVRPLDRDGRVREWFREAADKGYEIDGGLDPLNACVRWRRTIDSETYEAIQYGYRTGRWTTLEDDSGIGYVSSRHLKAEELPQDELYSITAQGAAFALNHYGLTHPYDGRVVQAVLDSDYKTQEQSIRILDARVGRFAGAMLGDVVRFRSRNPAVDGVARVITSARDDTIGFAAVVGLQPGDEFIVAATRFRLRFAPVLGRRALNVKTLTDLFVRAMAGPRHGTGGNWPAPVGGRFTARVFEEYRDATDRAADREIPVTATDDSGVVTRDRISLVEGQGTALEIELECLEARTDFRLEQIEARVREDGDLAADVSATR